MLQCLWRTRPSFFLFVVVGILRSNDVPACSRIIERKYRDETIEPVTPVIIELTQLLLCLPAKFFPFPFLSRFRFGFLTLSSPSLAVKLRFIDLVEENSHFQGVCFSERVNPLPFNPFVECDQFLSQELLYRVTVDIFKLPKKKRKKKN